MSGRQRILGVAGAGGKGRAARGRRRTGPAARRFEGGVSWGKGGVNLLRGARKAGEGLRACGTGGFMTPATYWRAPGPAPLPQRTSSGARRGRPLPLVAAFVHALAGRAGRGRSA